jgi:hypothetical protein
VNPSSTALACHQRRHSGTMGYVTGLLGAFAAFAAAIASMVTLAVTTVVLGRREHRRWSRAALTDAFVAYLDASWRGSDAIAEREGLRAKHSDVDAQVCHVIAEQAYQDMRSHLTRLRLLASSQVLAAGQDLLRRQRHSLEADGVDVESALAWVSAGRRSLVDAAKREMGL